MKASTEIGALAAALAKAQGAFSNPERNRAVKVAIRDKNTREVKGDYTFHYTTLDRVIDVIRKPMSDNGLAFTQSVTVHEDWAIVTTRIMHESGQWIEDELPVKPDGFGPQQVGSAITYGKRYSLTALLGIASDEDDDGNLASGNTSEETTGPPPRKELPECPKCGKADAVIVGKQEYGGGFVCFGKKGGCGHKWQKAADIAAEHGLKTGDQIQPPSDRYKKAIDKITAAVRDKNVNEIARIMNFAEDEHAAGRLSQTEQSGIANECTLALKKIKAAEKEPIEGAAA